MVPGPAINALVTSDERDAIDALARAMAAALRDANVRQEVKAALAGSAVTEQKLHFNSFMEGRGGNIIAAAARVGRGAAFAAASGRIRPIEFYMPIAAHRSRWVGDGNIIVAYMLDERKDEIIGYRTDGTRLVLDRSHPPDVPVLSLVPVETDFGNQIPLNRLGRQPAACAVSASETLENAAGRCGVVARTAMAQAAGQVVDGHRIAIVPPPSREVYGPITQNGLYMTFSRVMDAHEPWVKGNPELEIHITGRKSPAPLPAGDNQCIGEHANDPGYAQPGIRSPAYVYDQNGNFWNGQVLLLSQAQVDSLQRYADGFTISVWEDDNEACVVHPSLDHSFSDYLNVVGSVVRGVTGIRAAHGINDMYQIFASTARDVVNFVDNGDDAVGVMVAKDSTAYAGQYPDNTHILYDGTTFNGRITLLWKTNGQTPPPTGPVAAIEVNPVNDTVAIGLSRQFQAVAYDAQGRIVDGTTISWSTANGGIASVGQDGYVVGQAQGQTTIMASASGISNSAPVTVKVPTLSVWIDGPQRVDPAQATTLTATFNAGGSAGPFTYQWGDLAAGAPNAQSITIYPTQSGSVTLNVFGAFGSSTSASFFVNVYTGGYCGDLDC